MIKIVFFAALREQLNCSEMSLDIEEGKTVDEIKQLLCTTSAHWQKTFSNEALLTAVNHDMVSGSQLVKQGDEVAFFPPVTGG